MFDANCGQNDKKKKNYFNIIHLILKYDLMCDLT